MNTKQESRLATLAGRALTWVAPFATVAVVIPLVVMFTWSVVVPQVFVAAVEKGLAPASLSFIQALGLTLMVGIFSIPVEDSNRPWAELKSLFKNFNLKRPAAPKVIFSAFGLVFASMVFIVIRGFMGTFLWGWFIPDIFVQAVARNVLPGTVTVESGVWISLACAVVAISSQLLNEFFTTRVKIETTSNVNSSSEEAA